MYLINTINKLIRLKYNGSEQGGIQMLLNMHDLLSVARSKGFAVGAFNICDSLLFESIMEAAEESNSPVIVEIAPPEVEFVGHEFFKYVVSRMDKSPIPCTLHLDHGKSISDCVNAINDGFTSVMIDGSELSFEENKEITRKVVEIAHSVNVSVEGEIGTIGALSDSVEGGVEKITYTQPSEVIEFVNSTSVDALAIAIGTAHGIYPKGMIPTLRIDILEEITKLAEVPLVLHGGSSNKDEEIEAACKLGVCKVNIASDYRKAFFSNLETTLPMSHAFWSPDVYGKPMNAAKETIKSKMKLFNSLGKATEY